MTDRLYPLLAVGFFYLIVFFVGLMASRCGRGETGSDSLVAGRRMPLWIGIFTMTATWVDGGYLNGTAEAVYGRGLAWAQAPWGFAISLVLGGIFFARVMRQQGFTTMLDPFQHRYGERLGALMYLPAMLGELFWTAGILTALGTTFGVLLHVDFRVSILVSATMVIAYTIRGGLWSIAYTDVVQLIMMAGGMFLCLPFVIGHFDSFGAMWHQYQARFPYGTSILPPLDAFHAPGWGLKIWTWWDSMLLLVFGGIPWHCYFQRVLSSPTPRVAQRLSIYAALACALMAVPPAILGMAGAVFDWRAHGLQPPAGDFLILPQVLRDMAPGWVGLAGLCAVAGAIMSSVDASIYSASSMFTWNIYHKIFNPAMDESQMQKVNRGAISVIGIAATLLALHARSVYALWFLCADLVYVLLFPQLLLVIYGRRVTSWGVAAGFVVSLILRVGGGEPALGLPAWIAYPSADGSIWFPFKTVAMLSGLVTTLAISYLPLRGGIDFAVPWLRRSTPVAAAAMEVAP